NYSLFFLTIQPPHQYTLFPYTTLFRSLVATAPPPAPSRVVAYPTSSTAMYIWWTDTATTETGFRVERSTDAGASWSVVGTTAARSEEHTSEFQSQSNLVCRLLLEKKKQ